jgi:hypothetical protein
MTPDAFTKFVKKTENMVSPWDVGYLIPRANMLQKLPRFLQKLIMKSASRKQVEMGFIVEPYALFLSYEITEPDKVKSLLPDDYELVPSAMFDDEPPKLCGIIGAFNVHTTVFWGSRVELYVIARNKRTGLMSWVICDYESNTISFDPGKGLTGPSTKASVITTTHTGDVVVDVVSKKTDNAIAVQASVTSGKLTALRQNLWVEGNMSVDYGGELKDEKSTPFSLVFDPAEMKQALRIPMDQVMLERNTFGEGWLANQPFEVCCFPFAQHFLTTQIPVETAIKDEDDLRGAVMDYIR